MSGSLQLQAAERIGRATRTPTQMSLHFRGRRIGKFVIQVVVEIGVPFATHWSVPRTSLASSSRMAFRARESRDITVPTGIRSVSAISR